MKKLLSFVLPLAAMLLGAACTKEMPGQAGNDAKEGMEFTIGEQTHSINLKFSVGGSPTTKAAATIGSYNDDTIARIDIYCYEDDYTLPVHSVLTGDDIETGFTQEELENTHRSFLVFANLNAAVAGWYETRTMSQLQSRQDSFMPLDLLYTPHQLVMAGYKEFYFTSDKTETIDLYRYMARVDLSQIQVDFTDASLMSKDVFVKNVAFVNVFRCARLVYHLETYSYEESPYFFWGGEDTVYHAFGGEDTGIYGFSRFNYMSDTFTAGSGTGALAGTWNALYNDNTYKAKGVLNIDVNGNLKDAVVQSYDTSQGEGRVCSSTDPSVSHTLNVNKSFYLMPGAMYSGSFDMLTPYTGQNPHTKLVIELSIDGDSYFYPILCYALQPNTVYQISKIKLKGLGSEYSNFYELVMDYDVSLDMSVQDWNTESLGEMSGGYLPGHKEEIY